MSKDTSQSSYVGIPQRYAVLVTVIVTLCVFAGAWMACSVAYEHKKDAVLAAYSDSLDSWVSGTSKAVVLWAGSLEEQAKRVSGSELYCLFASELGQMDEKACALINEAGNGVPLPEDLGSLSEEVPAIRNMLLDFMNYSGLLDARIVNRSGQTLLSALSRPSPITPEQRAAVERAMQQRSVVFAPVRGSAAGLVVDMIDPLTSEMAPNGPDGPSAALLITAPVTGQVAQFMARDLRRADFKPHLLQRNGDVWEEVRVQSAAPVALTPDMAAAFSGMGERLPFGLRPSLDGAGQAYSLAANVPGMDWWVALEIPSSVVGGELRTLGWLIYGIGGLISLGVVLGLALLWWILVGRQRRIIAERFEQLYTLIARQKRLLDSVNVSLNVGLFMSDPSGVIQVGNRAFAAIAGTDETTLAGSALSALFDGKVSGLLLDNIRRVSRSEQTDSFELTLDKPDGERLYRVTLYPFNENIENNSMVDGKDNGAVAIMQDITEFRRNSERHRLQQLHTMDAFVRAIEGVDPYLSGHSRKMSELGALLADRMGLAEADTNTIAMAARLSQVGKLFVPRELLGKSGKLTEEEQVEMAKVPEHAYRVLKDIDFDLPVPQAIYEMYERVDGTGYPQHLKGEDITVHARVLAVVNAFCAMVSPRSYRKGMTFDEAIDALRQNPGSYDQRIVDLLVEARQSPEGAQVLGQL